MVDANHPGGNVTGLSIMSVELGSKRLGLLHELLPNASSLVALINPDSTIAQALIKEAQASASGIGRQIEIAKAGTSRDIDAAFASFAEKTVDALFVSP